MTIASSSQRTSIPALVSTLPVSDELSIRTAAYSEPEEAAKHHLRELWFWRWACGATEVFYESEAVVTWVDEEQEDMAFTTSCRGV